MLWISVALADDSGTYVDDFSADLGAWSGGSVADGVLRVTDGDAILGVESGGRPIAFTLDARVRLATDGVLRFGADGAEIEVTIAPPIGSAAFAGDALPLPMTHLTWVPDVDPVLEATGDGWEAGGLNHPEVFRDDDGTWFLYYTAWFGPPGYGYRQIGLATSPDGVSWTRYAGNPVLTIDYDLTAVDGVHVHMPTVVRAPDATWHMFYACYQNNVGNRICHATSPDGYSWTPFGVAIDRGEPDEFDGASLRMPDVWIAPDGVWHLWYDGTTGDEHYGATGYATSTDGYVWTKHGELLAFDHALQGLSVVETPYGLDAVYNRDDYFVHASAAAADPTTWTETGSVLAKGWAWWNDGYIQAPTLWLDGTTYRMWFNGYTYTDGFERLGAAHTEPVAGTWLDVHLEYDLGTMKLAVDGAERSFDVDAVGPIHLAATGTAELDDVRLDWTAAPGDTDPGDTDGADTDLADTDAGDTDGPRLAAGGCGCDAAAGSGPAAFLAFVMLAAARRARARG